MIDARLLTPAVSATFSKAWVAMAAAAIEPTCAPLRELMACVSRYRRLGAGLAYRHFAHLSIWHLTGTG